MSNLKYIKPITCRKVSVNKNLITSSNIDENNSSNQKLYVCNEVNQRNAGQIEKKKSNLCKFIQEKITVEAQNISHLSNNSAQEQCTSCQSTTPPRFGILEKDLPDELLNIGPSEKLIQLRRSNSSKKPFLETTLPGKLLNVGPSEKLQRLRGPTPQSKRILKSSLPGELQHLGPSEKLKRLRGPKLTNGSLGNGLPNKLCNIGPSEKLRKLRGPAPPNRSLLKRLLPNEDVNSAANKTLTKLQETSSKPKGSCEKPYQIFQKRLQAIMKKPQTTIKRIEPVCLNPNQVINNITTNVQQIECKEVGNKFNTSDGGKSPSQKLTLILKGSGDNLIGPQKFSKFFKVPLDAYNELREASADSHSLDKKKTEHIFKHLHHSHTVTKQNDEGDGLSLATNKVTISEPEYIEDESLLKTTKISQNSNNYCGDVKQCNVSQNYDAPRVKINSKRTISISRPQNKNLRNEFDEINKFRRKIFPKTYKRNIKGRFLFGLRNKVTSKTPITGLAATQFLPNRMSDEPLEPINLEAGEWHKLYTASDTRMPVGSIIAPMIHRLRERLPTLTGRDKLEVSFLLSMMSSFPNMQKQIKELMYQRLNLVYIAIMFNWETALALAQASEHMLIKPSSTAKSSMNGPILQSKLNSQAKSLNSEHLANTANGSIINCASTSDLSKGDNARVSLKPQYHFEILIKENSLPLSLPLGD